MGAVHASRRPRSSAWLREGEREGEETTERGWARWSARRCWTEAGAGSSLDEGGDELGERQ